jgi:hypothetical protein
MLGVFGSPGTKFYLCWSHCRLAIQELERQKFGGPRLDCVLRPDYPWQLINPLALRLFYDVLLYACEYDAVCSFYHPIGLRMVDRSEAQLHSQLLAESPEVCTIELFPIVNCYLLWHAEAAYDILLEKFL